MNKMKRMLRGIVRWFGFSYRIAWTITLILSIGTAALAFVVQDDKCSSLMFSVSAGFFTGFVIFFISGLKKRDKEYYESLIEKCDYGDTFFTELSDQLKPFYISPASGPSGPFDYLKDIGYDIQKGYLMYSAFVVRNVENRQARERFKKKEEQLKELVAQYKEKIIDKIIQQKNEPLSEDSVIYLRSLYLMMDFLSGDFSFIKMEARNRLEQLRYSKF